MSPIEDMMMAALCSRSEVEMDLYIQTLNGSCYGNFEGDEICILVSRSTRIGGYVVDFLARTRPDLSDRDVPVAIECDGHDWHSLTKQQASHDRSRDRDLLKLGVSTIRFTGSDIHRDPDRCAQEVFECVRALTNSLSSESQRCWENGYSAAFGARSRLASSLYPVFRPSKFAISGVFADAEMG